MANPRTTALEIRQLGVLVREVRKVSSDMQAQTLDVLIQVASNPGISISEIAKLTNLSQPSVTRNVQLLNKWKKLGEPGLGMIEDVDDPRDSRRRMLFLTAEGKVFLTRVVRAMLPDFSFDNDTDARLEVEQMHESAKASNQGQPKRGRINPVK